MSTLTTFIAFMFVSAADTLASAYQDVWKGVQEPEHSSVIMQTMASNGLIMVVLGVSLIIWFVLIGYLVRLEKKINRLEQKLPE